MDHTVCEDKTLREHIEARQRFCVTTFSSIMSVHHIIRSNYCVGPFTSALYSLSVNSMFINSTELEKLLPQSILSTISKTILPIRECVKLKTGRKFYWVYIKQTLKLQLSTYFCGDHCSRWHHQDSSLLRLDCACANLGFWLQFCHTLGCDRNEW